MRERESERERERERESARERARDRARARDRERVERGPAKQFSNVRIKYQKRPTKYQKETY